MDTETNPEVPLRPLTALQQSMIALAMVAMGAGMMINFVVVAPLAREAGLAEIEVAGILTLSAAIYALMIPRWGEWANRFGRKRIMVFSLTAMGLTNMAFLFALEAALAGILTGSTMFFTLVFVRVWFGLLSPGLQPASMAAMTDATTATTRAAGLGMIGAAMSFGSILGPASAAVLAEFGVLVPLWGTIFFNLLCAVILGFVLPPTKPRARSSTRPKPLAVRDPRVFPHLLFLFIYFVGVGMIQQTLGWFLEDRYALGREDAVRYAGIAFSCLAVMMIVVQFGYIQPRKPDPRKMLPVGLALVAVGYIAADTLFPFWAVCVSFLIVGLGAALTVPAANALGSLSVERHEQGSAAALLSMAPPSGFIFGPLIGAGVYQIAPALPMLISAALMVSLAVYAFFVVGRRPMSPS